MLTKHWASLPALYVGAFIQVCLSSAATAKSVLVVFQLLLILHHVTTPTGNRINVLLQSSRKPFIYYPRQGGYVSGSVCVRACHFVILSVNVTSQKVLDEF